jgi:glycerophosphodiester phosphodiesterase
MLFVHLGSTQGGHDRATIQLGHSHPNDTWKIQQGLPLELHISIFGTSNAKIIQLPLLDDQLHKPIVFKVKDSMPLQIVLQIYRCESNHKEIISSGTSVLDQENVLGDKHESLMRERTVYLTDMETSGPAGTVLLSYLVAKPFMGLETARYSSSLQTGQGLVRLVGHRGVFSPQSFLHQQF